MKLANDNDNMYKKKQIVKKLKTIIGTKKVYITKFDRI